VYQSAARFDNVHLLSPIGGPFIPGTLGQTHRADATSLPFRDNSFDFVLASHQLQRLRNPLKALTEWHRVLARGGRVIGILPWKDMTFDHRRSTTTFCELKEHFAKDESEISIMDHVTPELLETYDFARDVGAGTPEQFVQRCKSHFSNRAFHVHVFDFALIRECLEATGFTLSIVQLTGMHQVFIAQKNDA
jgi:SAM-dependent methyltransferase